MAITSSSTRAGIHASSPKVSTSTTRTGGRTGGNWSSAGEESFLPVAPTGSTTAPTKTTPFTFVDQTKGGTNLTSPASSTSGASASTGWYSGGGRNITLMSAPKTPVTPLTAEQIEERYGIKGKFGSVFTGELEGLFRTLGEWEKAADPNYDIFTSGLPGNVGEAYMGLSQALSSDANQVTEIQVMDIDTATALTTTVGATVYYKGGRKLEASSPADQLLIEQKEVLDTYRPFAMARVQEAIDMKNEVTLQGIEDAFTRQREDAERTFKAAVEGRKQEHEAALSVAEVKATGTEARATAQVKGQEDRQTLNLKYKAEAEEAEKAHERDLDIMDATLWNEQQKIRSSTEASRYLGQINWELEMASTEMKQSFAANQAALDRAVTVGDMELTANLQTQSNVLQAEMIDTQRQQMQMDWIMGLVSNPVTLYMVQQSGLLGTIGAIGGADVESAVSQVLAAVPERSLSNIQNINARSDFENEIDSFTVSMQRGMSSEAYKGYVSGTAPYTRGQESRMAAGRPTDYSEFIQGPTTESQLQGPDIATGFYRPDPMGNIEDLMSEGAAIRKDTGEVVGDTALTGDEEPGGFSTTAAYQMAMGITPTAEPESWTQTYQERGTEGTEGAEGTQTSTAAEKSATFTNFKIGRPTDFSSTGGNAQMFMLNDAPTQILRAIPDIGMNEAQEMSRKAMNYTQRSDQFGETVEDKVNSAYGILESWVRGYGVFAVDGVWWDRNKELGPGAEGRRKANTAREAYRTKYDDPAKGTGVLYKAANR